MRVEPIVPDAPPGSSPGDVLRQPFDGVYLERSRGTQGYEDDAVAAFTRALDAIGMTLADATRAEDAFAYGRGTLEAAVYERAQADVTLSAATATAQRIAQAVASVLNMQV